MKDSLVIHSSQIMLTRKGMTILVASIVLEKDQADESMSLYGGLVDDGIELDDNTSYEQSQRLIGFYKKESILIVCFFCSN